MKTMRFGMGGLLCAMCMAMGLVATGCGSDDSGSDPSMTNEPQKTLYEKYGGHDTVVLVVKDFIGVVAADTRINGFFADTAADQARLKNLNDRLVEQLGSALGGPETYTGKDMVSAHKGMNIKDADFDALVEDLVKVLKDSGVETSDIEAIGAALAPLRADIVGK